MTYIVHKVNVRTEGIHVGFEVVTPVVMKSSVF
jgi:hypothetical protein